MKIISVVMAAAMTLLLARAAWADAVDTARAHDQAFDNALLACTPEAALDLYEEHAAAIYPGEGELGGGNSEILKLIKNFDSAFCPDDQKKAAIKSVSLSATPMGPDFIMIIRQFEVTDKLGNTALVRATELIHQKDGKWRYVVVHASVGLPRAPAGGGEKPGQ
ncbi:MAG: hypothetical protein ACREQT_09765 [Candidatus Binataceae bacterium]